jgi:hypothetical protein
VLHTTISEALNVSIQRQPSNPVSLARNMVSRSRPCFDENPQRKRTISRSSRSMAVSVHLFKCTQNLRQNLLSSRCSPERYDHGRLLRIVTNTASLISIGLYELTYFSFIPGLHGLRGTPSEAVLFPQTPGIGIAL